MAQAPSQTGIVNDALTRLGATTFISSLDDDRPSARHARAAWESSLRLLIASHPWNFAIRRAKLNAGAAPAFGYDHSFALPADCLRWLPPSEDDEDDEFFEGVEEAGFILSDAAAPLPIRYISRDLADDMTRWPPHFCEALTLELAARMAEPITQSESIKADMSDQARRALIAAKRTDGLASGKRRARKVTRKSDWLRARHRPYFFHGR